jgi:hypothetical protein
MQPLLRSWTISGFFAIARDLDTFPKRRATNLEVAVKAGEPEAIETAYDEMLESCNDCHRASQRAFIKVERRVDNPYMQSFE